MEQSVFSIDFFLGANNKTGYYSLYDEAYDPAEKGCHYILKGGPGTGKSTLMKNIAAMLQKDGYLPERDYCSADPNSLDAVFLPEKNFSILDGTAPHTFDPRLPGVTEHLVNLGEAWNTKLLEEHRNEIASLVKENGRQHKKCAEYLWVASQFELKAAKLCSSFTDAEKLEDFSVRLARRKIPEKESGGKKGRLYKRFLSGITPDGIVTQYDTLTALCDTMIVFEDAHSVAAPFILRCLTDDALAKGYDVYLCFCPLLPHTKPEHLIIPELHLCFCTENEYHPSLNSGEKTIHSSRFFEKDDYRRNREKLLFMAKAKKELIDEAVKKLSIAKGLHDKLEEYYIAATDFSIVEEKQEKICREVQSYLGH